MNSDNKELAKAIRDLAKAHVESIGKLSESNYDDDGYVIQWFRSTTPVTDDEDLEMFHRPSAAAFLEQEQRRRHAHENKHERAAVA